MHIDEHTGISPDPGEPAIAPAPSGGAGSARAAREQMKIRLQDAIRGDDLERVVELAWKLYYHEFAGFMWRKGAESNDIDDLVQDVFALMVEGWQNFDGRNLRAWLYVLARYTWLSHRARVSSEAQKRAIKARQPSLEDLLGISPLQQTMVRQELAMVLEVMRDLDPIDQEIFKATWCDECSTEEVASRLLALFDDQLSLGAIRARRHRMRQLVADRVARISKKGGAL